ncbi:RNA-directed DNA polymerase from mobile element jockey-like protein [Pitangus sulphuratus]|nr:RNA-directed DNA polymerase from mobile element jockey-like protein [Pitangus sulphuratus]
MSSLDLSMTFEQSWEPGEISNDRKMANVVLVFQKGKKDDPGNYRPVSLTSITGIIMKKIILGVIEKYLKDNAVISPSQHRFMRRKSCLTNLISFYGDVTHLVDEGKPVHVIFSDFSKASDTVSHSILLDKTPSTQLDKHIVRMCEQLLASSHSSQHLGTLHLNENINEYKIYKWINMNTNEHTNE